MNRNHWIIIPWFEHFEDYFDFLRISPCSNASRKPRSKPAEKNLSGIIFKKMYINAFLCILLSSVAAIDFDSEYIVRRGSPRAEISQE